jgi:hypothetical protein
MDWYHENSEDYTEQFSGIPRGTTIELQGRFAAEHYLDKWKERIWQNIFSYIARVVPLWKINGRCR